MGLWDFLTKDNRINHNFNEKDRELSLQRRQEAKELATLRQSHALAEEKARHETKMIELNMEKLEKQYEYEDLLAEQEEELPAVAGISEEGQMMMQLLKTITPQVRPPAVVANNFSTPPPTTAGSISDEELLKLWQQVPPNIKAFVPKCNDEQIKEFVTQKMIPNADEDTLNRAVRLARNT